MAIQHLHKQIRRFGLNKKSKLVERFKVVKEKVSSKEKSNEPRLGCQSNCIGCAGVN
jgi:hypothetical protein